MYQKTKVELQAQLEEITEERTKLNLEKQQMHMEEQRILAKYIIHYTYVHYTFSKLNIIYHICLYVFPGVEI